MTRTRSAPPCFCCALFALAFLASPAFADIINVQNFADSGPGTLRDAIDNAVDGDSIHFLESPPGTVNLTSGPLVITTDITIDGSFSPDGITIDAGGLSGIFEVSGANDVVFKSLNLTGGSISAGVGSAISQPSGGSLWIEDCRIENNECTSGGIFTIFYDGNTGDEVFMVNTTVDGNTGDTGAGVFLRDARTIVIGCTFSNLTETNIGGVGTGPLTIARDDNPDSKNGVFNTTFSGNRSSNGSAGIFCLAQDQETCTVNAVQCTITNNTFVTTGDTTIPGVGSANTLTQGPRNANLDFDNCIVSGNTVDGASGDIAQLSIDTGENNLVGVGGGYINGVNGNIVGFTNPMLSPLQDNGGATLTHIPVFGSPAVDGGSDNNFGLVFDQRELPRLVGAAPDIGSVEGVDNSARLAALNAKLRQAQRDLRKAKRKGDRRGIKKAKRKIKRFKTEIAAL